MKRSIYFIVRELAMNCSQELRIYRCNDIMSSESVWSMMALCPNLSVLAVEGLNFRVSTNVISELSSLKKVRSIKHFRCFELSYLNVISSSVTQLVLDWRGTCK